MKIYNRRTFKCHSIGSVMLGLLCLALVCCSGSRDQEDNEKKQASSFVDAHGQLRVEGTVLKDQHGAPLALRGVSLGWHQWWPRFYDTTTVRGLHDDWSCNLIRAAIGVEPDGGYLQKPDLALERLYTVVDEAIRLGMYVIVDWHSHERHTAEAKDFFVKIATKYGKYPNVLYEIYNEPVEDSWAEVKAYAEEIIAAIRPIDPDNIILVSTPHWAQDIHLAADDPIVGQHNIMYTLHFYAATHKQYLRDRVEYALKKQLPVFVSECASMEASGNGAIDHTEWKTWVDWMAKHRLSWVAWSIADKDETCSMIKDTSSPRAQWKDADLKEWGIMVRDLLKEGKHP